MDDPEAVQAWLASTMHEEWDDDEYPGFEEYGVPTQEQIDKWLVKVARREAHAQWLKDNPVYTCRDLTRKPTTMEMFDALLKKYYGDALRHQINSMKSVIWEGHDGCGNAQA